MTLSTFVSVNESNSNKESLRGRLAPLYREFRETLKKSVEHLSFAERIIFYVLSISLILSSVVIVFRLNDYLLVEIPARGGSFTEGIIGSPRFINPVLAISDADRDLTALIYSGLLKTAPDGSLLPDMAESYTLSPDGLTYTFILKNGLLFHDGMPITAEDVEFTVLKAQDSAIKSPKRANWDSVRVEKISDREIHFVLKQPYSPFLENTTMGILPKHIWKNLSAEEFAFSLFNVEPIGSGPFMIKSISRNSSGIPESYILSSFKNYTLGEPYIKTITISFHPSETAIIDLFKQSEIESINSVTPIEVSGLPAKNSNIITSPLSRVFGVFFNQNQAPIFAEGEVRKALDISIDKKAIVDEVLSGFGVVAESPIPKGFLDSSSEISSNNISQQERISRAKNILEESGWKLNQFGIYEKTDKKKNTKTLSFSIATSDASELKKTVALIKETWEKVGAKVDVKIFEAGDLSQNIIRPRKYDALLFGEIIGNDLDLFAFWHSSQRNDPGLNIALYTNIKADKLLSDARVASDREERFVKYREFEKEIKKDIPAVFLYSPTFVYLSPKKIKAVDIGHVTVPSERFSNVHNWYIETEKVWKIFNNKRILK